MEKISVLGGIDPYVIESEKFNCNIENFPAVTYPDIVNYLIFGENFPAVTYPDIVNYLIFGSSPFTANQLKAYKSLEAYNQAIEGWVRDVKVYLYDDKRLAIGKVATSFRIHSYFFFSSAGC